MKVTYENFSGFDADARCAAFKARSRFDLPVASASKTLKTSGTPREATMGSYRISMQRNAAHAEFSVRLHDDSARPLARVDALNTMHAKKVARDLISLVRRRDPESIFVVRR
ncbi:MAG: hypothetical protein V9G24_01490 [Rhodoblastus sp.]